MDLLDRRGVTWGRTTSPTCQQHAIFRGFDPTHLLPVTAFFGIAGSATCPLPAVSFVDPAFGSNAFGTNPDLIQFDEHPPSDIRKGQYFVSQIVNTLRNSSCWQDSILFITWDEHGGSYDHVAPPRAKQGEVRTPTGSTRGSAPTSQTLRRASNPAPERKAS
jgi:phospholipase C